MRLKSVIILLAAIMLFQISGLQTAQASHGMGADISYVCLGNDSFLITLNFYRDCEGINAPTSASLQIGSPQCGISLPNLTLALQNPGGTEVSPLCAAQIGQSQCNGGNLPGVEQFNYTAIVQLPQSCPDWTFSYSLCCRNDDVTNLQSPDSRDLYVEATLNNAAVVCNDSPEFTSLPVPYICANQPFNYNHGAIDADGDSLVYSSIPPQDAGANIPYISPYNSSNPLNTVSGGGFVLNPRTGQMTFTPNGQQVPVITILVEEYRNGQLIGSTLRDIQVNVLNCSNNQPTVVDGGIQNLSGGVELDSVSVGVCPGESVSFDVKAYDPDGAITLTMTSNVSQAIPGATYTIALNADTITGTFAWTPTALDTGNNVFTVQINDGACPIEGRVIYSFNVFVLDGTFAGPDLTHCTDGVPAQLNALGGSSFTWSPTTGLNNPNIRNPLASPTVTTTYIVTSDLSPVCKNMDTVTVQVVPNFLLSLEPMDDTIDICRNSLIQLEVMADSTYAPYTYSWEPASSVNNPSIPNPLATPSVTSNYVVTVMSDTGCTIKDSLLIEVVGVGPLVKINADDNFVCPGDTVNLTSEVYDLSCGPAVVGCSAQNPPSASVPLLNSSSITFFGTPFQGTSPSSRYQALYLASDLNAIGVNTGTITRIAFEVGTKASDATGIYQNLTVKMGCTDNGSLQLGTWENVSTVVFGPAPYITSTGVNTFNLSQPYDWDGVSNLVIEICYTNANSINGNDELYSTDPNFPLPYNASMRSEFAIGSDGCTLAAPTNTNGFIYNRLPNTTFFMCDPLPRSYTYTWAPTNGLSNPNAPNTSAVVNGEITYTLSVSDTLCDGSDFITLNIDTSFNIDAITDTTICEGDTIQLDVLVTGSPPIQSLNCGVNGTSCTSPQTNKSIGNGTIGLADGTPYKGFWETGKQQYLFLGSELQAAGVQSGTITELAWLVTGKASSIPYESFTISMGCTNISTMPASSYYTGPLSVVYNPKNYSTVSGNNVHVLDNPFDWDGFSNIVVEVCFTQTPGNWTADDEVAFTPTSFNSVRYGWTDGLNGCAMNIIQLAAQVSVFGGDFGIGMNRPNITFKTCNAPPGNIAVTWTSDSPGTLSNTNIPNPKAYPNTSANYYAEVLFINGCLRYDTVTVDVLQFSTSLTADTGVCPGESVPLLATGANSYTWSPDPSLSNISGGSALASPDTTTTYYVTIADSSTGCSVYDSVTVTVFNPPMISFGNDSLLCFVDSVQLSAGTGFASYLWSTNATTPSITVTQAGVYSVTVTDVNGCTDADTVELKVSAPPQFTISNDTTVCLGETIDITASAGDPNVTYLWNTQQTDSTISVTTSGLYVVTVTDTNSCPSFDSVTVIFNDVTINLPPDILLCPTEELLLVAGPDNRNYVWSTGSTDSSITITFPGDTVSVTVIDSIGCTDADTIGVSYSPDNSVDLGADTFLCNNGTIVLNAGPGYISYLWSPSGSISQAITVATGDTFSVNVTDNNGCAYMDTIIVQDLTPIINIGDVVGICTAGDTITLSAPFGYSSYLWSTNEQSRTIRVSTFGNYSVTVTAANGCTGTDDVDVVAGTNPTPNLGPDDSICAGQSLELFPGFYTFYNWQDESSDSIFTVTSPGTYSVTVTNAQGCVGVDSIQIALLDSIVFPPLNVSRCQGDVIVLSAPNGYVVYSWSTGDSTQTITVSADGSYSFSVVDANGCEGTGTINVTEQTVTVAPTATPGTIGDGESSQLDANASGSSNFVYDWTPSSSLNDATIDTPMATPTVNTVYTVTATDSVSGCSATDTVEVLVGSDFVIPGAFTPNGDGQNDLFEIITVGNLEIQEFRIYNRWGEVLHDDPANGWDGTYQGEDQPVGSYIYYVEVRRLDSGNVDVSSDAFSLFR